MLLRRLWCRLRGTSLLEQLSSELAGRLSKRLRDDYRFASVGSSVAEVRGYLRARAAETVDRAVSKYLAELPERYQSLAPQLTAATLQRLTDQLAPQLVASGGATRRRRRAA